MNLLLDTHIVLWWLADSDELPDRHRETIADRRNGVWVSAASVWEIGIKRNLGKLSVPDGLLDVLHDSRFEQLAIRWHHAEAAARLPAIHRDPFDRVLVAQAVTENLTLATSDPVIERYDVTTL